MSARLGHRLAGTFILLAGAAMPVSALVGTSAPAPELAPYVVMVLKRSGAAAGFCSASVVAQNVVLTAAHCVAEPADTRVHFRDEKGEPVMVEVAAIVPHPGYRTDAARRREVSIDMALVRLAEPLPARFKPVALADAGKIEAGQMFRIAGFGVMQEGAASTGGALREARVAARLPLSSILLWANDPQNKGTGACTGDSGGPILALNEPILIAVADWAEGAGGQKCGMLTQGALVAPQRGWIESVMAGWRQ
jgi:secreted trypsin-like serine protease